MPSLDLITYNTWHCEGDYLRRLKLMRERLRELEPDVLLLQEAYVERDSALSTPEILAYALDMDYRYLPAARVRRKTRARPRRGWSGMALLSRLPILASKALPLPSPRYKPQRIAQLAQLKFGDERLLVVNVHLSYHRRCDSLRIAQLRQILEHSWLRQDYAGILLAGDLNSPPNSAPMQWLRTQPGWRVIDCFQALRPEAIRGSTLGREWTRQGVGPNVDYVLMLEPTRQQPHPLEPADAYYVLGRREGHYPSDHLGIQVRLQAL